MYALTASTFAPCVSSQHSPLSPKSGWQHLQLPEAPPSRWQRFVGSFRTRTTSQAEGAPSHTSKVRRQVESKRQQWLTDVQTLVRARTGVHGTGRGRVDTDHHLSALHRLVTLPSKKLREMPLCDLRKLAEDAGSVLAQLDENERSLATVATSGLMPVDLAVAKAKENISDHFKHLTQLQQLFQRCGGAAAVHHELEVGLATTKFLLGDKRGGQFWQPLMSDARRLIALAELALSSPDIDASRPCVDQNCHERVIARVEADLRGLLLAKSAAASRSRMTAQQASGITPEEMHRVVDMALRRERLPPRPAAFLLTERPAQPASPKATIESSVVQRGRDSDRKHSCAIADHPVTAVPEETSSSEPSTAAASDWGNLDKSEHYLFKTSPDTPDESSDTESLDGAARDSVKVNLWVPKIEDVEALVDSMAQQPDVTSMSRYENTRQMLAAIRHQSHTFSSAEQERIAALEARMDELVIEA